MRGRNLLMALAFLFGATLYCSALAAQGPHRGPELLNYDLLWAGVKAGTATLGIENGTDGGSIIRSTARSEDWVSVFFPVKDLVESTLTPAGYPSHYTMKINEGSTHKDCEYAFDRYSVRYVDNILKKDKTYDSNGPVYDPLSAFNHIRWGDIPDSGSVHVSLFDSRKFSDVEVAILGREKITVPAGTFDTIKIQPKLQSEGIFSSRGAIYVWVTNDSRRLPVRLLTKVLVGSISAELTSFQQ